MYSRSFQLSAIFLSQIYSPSLRFTEPLCNLYPNFVTAFPNSGTDRGVQIFSALSATGIEGVSQRIWKNHIFKSLATAGRAITTVLKGLRTSS